MVGYIGRGLGMGGGGIVSVVGLEVDGVVTTFRSQQEGGHHHARSPATRAAGLGQCKPMCIREGVCVCVTHWWGGE